MKIILLLAKKKERKSYSALIYPLKTTTEFY